MIVATSTKVKKALSIVDDLDGEELRDLRKILRAREAVRLDVDPVSTRFEPISTRDVTAAALQAAKASLGRPIARVPEVLDRERPSSDDLTGVFIAFRCGARTVNAIPYNPSDFVYQQQEYGLSCFDCIDHDEEDDAERVQSWKPNWAIASERIHTLMTKVVASANGYRKETTLSMIKSFRSAIDHCAAPSRNRYCYVLFD